MSAFLLETFCSSTFKVFLLLSNETPAMICLCGCWFFKVKYWSGASGDGELRADYCSLIIYILQIVMQKSTGAVKKGLICV